MEKFMQMDVKKLIIVDKTRIIPQSKVGPNGESDIMDIEELKPTPLSKMMTMDLKETIVYLCPNHPHDMNSGNFYVYLENNAL